MTSKAPTGGRLVIASNRIPMSLPGEKTKVHASGLVSALLPAIRGAGDVAWFGWSGKATAPGTSRPTTRTSRAGPLRLVGIDLPEPDAESYYNGFCNSALWPLLHSFTERFRADESEYADYRSINRLLARTIHRHLRPGDRVWIHDFHLIPLGAELRRRGWLGPIGFFLHTPFPPHEVFAALPWAEELLRDLVVYDLIGFHARTYLDNYERAVVREIGDATEQRAGVYPIGIDPEPYATWAEEPLGRRRGSELREAVRGRMLILSVDRLDYTKGVVHRLRTIERFFELHPEWRQRVSVLQISAPTRTRVAEYARQRREVEELVGHLNGRLGDPDWVPIRYLFRAFTQRELAAFYREADVALVTPLRDGMNLVAKEFVASQTGDPGVLVLSRFAGAAEELREALIVNPHDADGTARALARALALPLAERAARQGALLERVQSQTAARWGASFLTDLGTASADGAAPQRAQRASLVRS